MFKKFYRQKLFKEIFKNAKFNQKFIKNIEFY